MCCVNLVGGRGKELRAQFASAKLGEDRLKAIEAKCEIAKQRAESIMKLRRDELATKNEKVLGVCEEMSAKSQADNELKLNKLADKFRYLMSRNKRQSEIKAMIMEKLNEKKANILRKYQENVRAVKQLERKRNYDLQEKHRQKLFFVRSFIVISSCESRMISISGGLTRVCSTIRKWNGR
eukprot:TRINITY_DN11040_c0_g1_i3.p1 TRINITY_DN11040_c0_g1~~TRINITY_DN11040_c0_g1_i3.p1  ORF type:complete len:181 (+),score=34.40 TRINITY_DN11040_c0_g1_i3:84-626(+)